MKEELTSWLTNLAQEGTGNFLRGAVEQLWWLILGALWGAYKRPEWRKYILTAFLIVIISFAALFIWVKTRAPEIEITTFSLEEGYINKPYHAELIAEVGGVRQKVRWIVNPLPQGLSLDSENGVIIGKPQASGKYEIKVTAMHGKMSSSRTLVLGISDGEKDDSDNSDITIIQIGEEVNGISRPNSRDAYRFHLPIYGRLYLRWQAGERTSSKKLYDVSIHHGNVENLIVTYNMTSTTSYVTSAPVFVTSGDYSVVVESKAGIAIPYHMIVQSEPMDSIELEENNSFSSATPIENDKGYSGSLQDRQDEDYYKFNLSEASAVNLALGTNGGGADVAAYTLTVYNENRGILTKTQAKGSSSFAETGNLYLRAGTYYVSVKNGNTWSGGAYTLTVRTSRKDVMEAESNDTLETANAIPVNKEVLASVGWEGDVDCFNFTLDKKAVVRPYFDFKRLGTDLKIYTLTLGDVYGKEIATFDFRGTGEPSKVIKPIAFEAGTYAMMLTRIKRDEVPFVLHEYTLRISAQPTK